MKMGILRTMLKRKLLKVKLRLDDKSVIELTANRSAFLKDSMGIADDTEMNVINSASAIILHSRYSLMQEVV